VDNRAFGAERKISGVTERIAGQLELWYPKPATAWTEGLAIGNGRLGAMIFGDIEKDRLQLNDITVWSGGPEPQADRSDAYKALPQIRQLLRDGKYSDAAKLIQQNMSPTAGYSPSYQTLGDLNFTHTLPGGAVTDYQRWLDISQAVAGVSFKIGAAAYMREIFSSAPAKLIAVRLACNQKAGVSFTLGLSRAGEPPPR